MCLKKMATRSVGNTTKAVVVPAWAQAGVGGPRARAQALEQGLRAEGLGEEPVTNTLMEMVTC